MTYIHFLWAPVLLTLATQTDPGGLDTHGPGGLSGTGPAFLLSRGTDLTRSPVRTARAEDPSTIQGEVEQPTPDQGEVEEATPNQGEGEQPTPDQGEVEQPTPDQGEVEQPTPDQGEGEEPTPDQGEVEQPVSTGKGEPSGPGRSGAEGTGLSGGVAPSGEGKRGMPVEEPGAGEGFSRAGSQERAGAGTDALTEGLEPFDPVPADRLTCPPRLKKGFNRAPAPPGGPRGLPIEGRVVVEFDVRKDGSIRDVRVVESPSPDLAERTLLDARRFQWYPAEVDGMSVDATVRLEIDWVRGAETSLLADAPFRKGELSMLGQVQLINAENSAGIGLGTANIDKVWYLEVRPNVNLHFNRLSIGFGTPLRFEIFDTNAVEMGNPTTYAAGFENAGRFRRADWDRFVNYPYTDLVRPIRYVTWGRKEEHLFVDVSRVHAITIGHGQLVRRYAPNVDIDESNIFAELDAYRDFGGMEVMAGPLPIPRLVGGLFFIKPLGPFREDYRSRSLSIGFTYLTDLNTPTVLTTSVDPETGRIQYPIDKGRFIYDGRDQVVAYTVQGVGVDTEFKPIKTKHYNIKTYVDYSHLFFPGIDALGVDAFGGGGATLGGLFRFSWGTRPVRSLDEETEAVRLGLAPRETKAAYAARLRAEVKTFGPQYVPSYFDSLYEVEKYQFGLGTTPLEQRATLPTKVAFLAGQAGEPWRLGYYLEATYALVDWFALSFVYQDAWPMGGENPSVPEAREIVFHVETQGLKFLQLFASYHYRHFDLDEWNRLFTFTSDNEIFYFGGRMHLWVFAINAGVQRGFRVDFLPDDGVPRPYEPGGEAYPHSSVGLENQWNYDLELELGWQF